MKKIATLISVITLAFATNAQTSEFGKPILQSTKQIRNFSQPSRTVMCPDTAGFSNITDFAPEFAATSGLGALYGYTGGGYIYGNNKSANNLRVCAQGYSNLGSTPVRIDGVLVYFGAKESDLGSSGTSKVVFSVYDMLPNKAYNTNGSGTFNQTTLNAEGPNVSHATADLLYPAIDTNNYNYVTFATPYITSGDFAIAMDVSTLAAGDTVGLVSDRQNDAQNLDFAFHKITTLWFVTDQLFSAAAAPALGSGGLDNDIAMWPVLCNAVGIGVTEYYNGMKLAANPNPAVSSTVIDYILEKDSKNVSLVVFDPAGRKIINKTFSELAAGSYKYELETANLASGNYFYQLNANGRTFTKKFVVTK